MPAPTAYVSQVVIEIVGQPVTVVQVPQVVVEIIGQPITPVYVPQVVVEIIGQPLTPVYVPQVVIEIIGSAAPEADIYQIIFEVALPAKPNVDVYQLLWEVAVPSVPATANIRQMLWEIALDVTPSADIYQMLFEVAIPTPMHANIFQMLWETAVLNKFVTLNADIYQALFEVAIPEVIAPPLPAPNPYPVTKYRIIVFDTNNNIVKIINNVRAFNFKDIVNGGSAEGKFTVQVVDAPTAYDTSGNIVARQYSTKNLSPTNQLVITTPLFHQIQFSGIAGPQNIIITLDDSYQIPISVTPNESMVDIAEAAVDAINAFNSLPSTPDYIPTYTAVAVGDGTIVGAQRKLQSIPVIVGVNPSPCSISATTDLPQVEYQQWWQYNYRVQVYLQDSVNPWYDGRIKTFAPYDPVSNTNDDRYITIETEGWQNALDDAIVTATINPGLQQSGGTNPNITAQTALQLFIELFQNSRIFITPKVDCGAFLYDMQFTGEGLASVINDIVTSVTSVTANTFEWWVRGLPNVTPGQPSVGVVIQPNFIPSGNPPPAAQNMGRTAPTEYQIPAYFVYEVKDQTIYDYQTHNTIQGLYNMVALYGGTLQTTQQQAFGAFADPTSISLFGLRQTQQTNNNLLTPASMYSYAQAYLILNGYPQPQTTYRKFNATDQVRSGVWTSILEPGQEQTIPQNLHQMRIISVEISIQEDQDFIEQAVTAAAPIPYVDHAFYGALQASANEQPPIVTGGSTTQSSYIQYGANWKGDQIPANTAVAVQLGVIAQNTQTSGTPAWDNKAQAGLLATFGQPPSQIGSNEGLVAGDGSSTAGQVIIIVSGAGGIITTVGVPGIPTLNNTNYIYLVDWLTGEGGIGIFEVDLVTYWPYFNGGSTTAPPYLQVPNAQDYTQYSGAGGGSAGIIVTKIGGGTGRRTPNASPYGNFGPNSQMVPSDINLQRLWQFFVGKGPDRVNMVIGATDLRVAQPGNATNTKL